MANTLLQMTNRVLRRLREDEVADLSEEYPALIAEFVADIAEEMNLTGPGWTALNHTINVAITASTRDYDLSAIVSNGGNVDNADTPTTEQSVMLHDMTGRPQAWIWDDASEDTGDPLTYIDPNTMERLFQADRDHTADDPFHFTLEKNADNDGWNLVLYPMPSAARHIRIRFNTPEAVLVPSTDAALVINVPNRPVYLGSLYLAFNERGEEIGEPGGIAERRYLDAKASAVEQEIRVRERAGYYDWERN